MSFSFEDLFKALPNLIKLFVPGFILIGTYRTFSQSKTESFESAAIWSLIISFVFQLVLALALPQMTEDARNFAAIIWALIAGILLVILKNLNFRRKVFKLIGNVTGSTNIWQDIFNKKRGAAITCYTEYDHENCTIEGEVVYYEACGDGECNIALSNYTITFSDNTKIEDNDESHMLHLNTKNICGLVVRLGEEKKRRKLRDFFSRSKG